MPQYIGITDGKVTNGFDRAADAASWAKAKHPVLDEEGLIARLKAKDTVLVRTAGVTEDGTEISRILVRPV